MPQLQPFATKLVRLRSACQGFLTCGERTQKQRPTAAQTLLAEHPRITGVVAGNDLIAVGIIMAAAERGRNCPRDISVVGFNDMLLASRLQTPLTMIRIPQYDVGPAA